MQKRLVFTGVLITIIILCSENVYAQSLGVDELYNTIDETTKDNLEEIGINSLDTVTNFDINSFLKLLQSLFQDKYFTPLKSMALGTGVIVLSSFLSAWQKESETFCQLAGVLSLCGIYLPYIVTQISAVTIVAQSITWFLFAAIPIYVALHVASGSVVLGTTYGGISILGANIFSRICIDVIIPLLTVFLGLSVSTALSHMKTKEITKSVYDFVKVVLVFCVTAFSGIISVQAAVAGASDIAATKTLKFVAGATIPVVGTAFADGVTAIRHSVGVLKSGAGAFGILAIVIMIMPTLTEILLWIFSCKVNSIIANLFSADKIVDVLSIQVIVLKTLLGILLSLSIISIIISAITLVGGA